MQYKDLEVIKTEDLYCLGPLDMEDLNLVSTTPITRIQHLDILGNRDLELFTPPPNSNLGSSTQLSSIHMNKLVTTTTITKIYYVDILGNRDLEIGLTQVINHQDFLDQTILITDVSHLSWVTITTITGIKYVNVMFNHSNTTVQV